MKTEKEKDIAKAMKMLKHKQAMTSTLTDITKSHLQRSKNMPDSLTDIEKFSLRQQITDYAKSLGFDLVGFSPAKIEEKYLKIFEKWLENGNAANMEYMNKIEQRRDMNKILPGVKSVIVLGMNYYHEQTPLKRGHGRIARYAYGRDYHKVIGKKLKKIEESIHKFYNNLVHLKENTKYDITKSYVDTGPLMERALAEQAGIGRIGKNGCLITEKFGSWIFLSEIITTIDLNFETKNSNQNNSPAISSTLSHFQSGNNPTWGNTNRWSSPSQKTFNICGNCTRCMTACPTGAIIAPGIVDSRLCISYLTIENRKKIPPKLAKIIRKTKRLFGCDICQEVCPHNSARQQFKKSLLKVRKNPNSPSVNTMQPSDSLGGLLTPIAGNSLNLKKLLIKNSQSTLSKINKISKKLLSQTSRPASNKINSNKRKNAPSPLSSPLAFLKTFAGSPLMRAKRQGLKRNAKILLKNAQLRPSG